MSVHIQDQVQVGDYFVYATGSSAVSGWDGYRPKQLGVFLDPKSWSRILRVSPVGYSPHVKIPEIVTPTGCVIFIDWPDFGVIGLDRFYRVIRKILSALKQGRSVEVGCIGAHGRTGTLLAGLLVAAEGLTARQAIQEVRARYCDEAVETSEQEQLLQRLECYLVPTVREPVVVTQELCEEWEARLQEKVHWMEAKLEQVVVEVETQIEPVIVHDYLDWEDAQDKSWWRSLPEYIKSRWRSFRSTHSR